MTDGMPLAPEVPPDPDSALDALHAPGANRPERRLRVPHVRGLVLAAGSGRRMGGPKALVRTEVGGPTLVERAVNVLVDGGCDGVTVVVGAASGEVRQIVTCLGRDVDVVESPFWQEGMGASLRSGLAALVRTPREGESTVAATVVLLVDLPDVGSDVVARLLDKAAGQGAPAEPGWRAALGRAAYAGRAGHPVLLGRDHWEDVVTVAVGDHGARGYFRDHDHLLVDCTDLATGRDVDRPEDLPGG